MGKKKSKTKTLNTKEVLRDEEEHKQHVAGKKRTAVEMEQQVEIDLQQKPQVDRDFLHQVS